MEFKYASLEWKADDEGTIEGYGSVFDVVDQGGDIIAPGAFKQSLASGRKVKMLYQHDASKVIGSWKSLEEDQKGLRVAGKLLRSVSAGAEAYEYVKSGEMDGLSIGFKTIKSMDRNGKRVIMQAELWEVSLVTFPMNVMARVDMVKAAAACRDFQDGNVTHLKRNVEEYLREAGFSNAEAKAGASALASKIGAMREAGTGLDELAQLLRQRASV
jgi:HK97 family phage prohead protease